MSDIDLDAIRAREQAATPGPWDYRMDTPGMSGSCWSLRQAGRPGLRAVVHEYQHGDENAEFIAHARTDVPALLAEVERLSTEVTYWSNTSKAQTKALARWQGLTQKAEAQVQAVRALADAADGYAVMVHDLRIALGKDVDREELKKDGSE